MKKPVVLIVTRGGRLSESTKLQALGVAKRLDVRILVTYVDTMPLLHDGGFRNQSFHEAAKHDIEDLKSRADEIGVCVDFVREAGKISKVVSRLCRILNSLKFIIADSGVKAQSVAQRATVPIFIVVGNQLRRYDKENGQAEPNRQPHICKLPRSRHDTPQQAAGVQEGQNELDAAAPCCRKTS